MLRTKVLLFEYIIALSFAFQVLLPEIFTSGVSLTTFIGLAFLKYKYEGLRLTLIIYIIIQAGFLLFSHSVINITLALLTYFTLSYFPIFEFPETKGPFLVGFKNLTLEKDLEVSVFYPTLEQTKRVMYRTTGDGYAKIYDIMRSYPNHFLPKFIYKLAFDFIEYLDIGVNLDARIIPADLLAHKQKFPVVVFSHGLSANRNLYTGFARQWASYGYIVFCIDHSEQIYVEFQGWNDYKATRAQHLNDRCRAISSVLNFVEEPRQIKKFFQDSEIDIDYGRVSLAGHSFGSAAVAQAASYETRVTGALILLDPWLFPVPDKILETPAKRPVLILRSESFANVIEEFKVKEKIKKYVEANKELQDKTISCYFKNTTHNSFCDLIVHMPREMKLFGIIEDPKDVEEVYNSQTMLSQIFLDLNLYSTPQTEDLEKKSLILKAFDSYRLKASGKSKLEIDSF